MWDPNIAQPGTLLCIQSIYLENHWYGWENKNNNSFSFFFLLRAVSLQVTEKLRTFAGNWTEIIQNFLPGFFLECNCWPLTDPPPEIMQSVLKLPKSSFCLNSTENMEDFARPDAQNGWLVRALPALSTCNSDWHQWESWVLTVSEI